MVLEIRNVRLAHAHADLSGRLYTVRCEGDKVAEVRLAHETNGVDNGVDAKGGLLLPSLCHSHIHLDKCYILDRGASLITGDFAEALRVTSDIKATFKSQAYDLYARGDKLIRASLEAGVTSMRAHVEVDKTVDDACLRAGVKLKESWDGVCDIQLSLFMQDPMFDSPEADAPGINATIASKALALYAESIGAVGSAPYVECTRDQQLANIRHVLNLAIQYNKHADFHLDYDLSPVPADPDSDSAPLIYSLLAQLYELRWSERMPGRTVTVGHATRLSLFSPAQLCDLRARIGSLPVHFVGLPQSDVYMMGRGSGERGTLNVCKLRREHGLRVAMGVNNVGNAFTPQGTPDPLGLCSLGAAVYQDGTPDGCRWLVEAVSTASKCAAGLSEGSGISSLVPAVGSPADFVILHDNHSLQSVALNPSYDRTTAKDGRVVAWRMGSRWFAC